jgi:hypothetical protein
VGQAHWISNDYVFFIMPAKKMKRFDYEMTCHGCRIDPTPDHTPKQS